MVRSRGNGVDYLKPGSHAWEMRQQRHTHNSYMGSARMMVVQAENIERARTTSNEAKILAHQIGALAQKLGEALQERWDTLEDGTKRLAGRRPGIG